MPVKKLQIIVIVFVSFFILSIANLASAAEICTWTKASVSKQPDGDLEYCPNNLTSDTNYSKCPGTMTPGQLCCCRTIATTVTTASSDTTKPPIFTIPDFQVQIPGLNKLATITCSNEGTCNIPWLGQYIAGIYNYALAIVGILAAIMLMAGGLIWLISGGDASRITQAKELIIGSITGVIIMASSYIILLQINPDLVGLKSITVSNVKKVEIYADDDITVVGGARAYGDACTASKNGDWSICAAYGERQPADLVTVEDVKVNSSVAQRYLAAMECVKAKNGKYLFYINEGWRSPAKQIAYKEKSIKNGGKPLTADPCCSNHGAGQAMDINRLDGQSMTFDYDESSGLKACMNAQTLYANLPSEPWHWSPTGR